MSTKEKLQKLKELHDWHMSEIEYWEQEIVDWSAMELPEQVEQARASLKGICDVVEQYIGMVCDVH